MIIQAYGVLSDGVSAIIYTGQPWHSAMNMSDVPGISCDIPDELRHYYQREQRARAEADAYSYSDALWQGCCLRLAAMPKLRRPPLKPRKRRGWSRIG